MLAWLILPAGCRHAVTTLAPRSPGLGRVPVLRLGITIPDQVQEGQTHWFRLRVPADQYVVLVIEGQGGPVDATLQGVGSVHVLERHLNAHQNTFFRFDEDKIPSMSRYFATVRRAISMFSERSSSTIRWSERGLVGSSFDTI